MKGSRNGCFIGIVAVAMVCLFAGWFVGELALAPVHCWNPVCKRWTRQLHLSMVSSFVGIGCLVLAAQNVRPRVTLPLGAGILGLTALAGMPNPGMFVVTGADLLLVVGVVGWLLVSWRNA